MRGSKTDNDERGENQDHDEERQRGKPEERRIGRRPEGAEGPGSLRGGGAKDEYVASAPMRSVSARADRRREVATVAQFYAPGAQVTRLFAVAARPAG
jgi:hypothetical protein